MTTCRALLALLVACGPRDMPPHVTLERTPHVTLEQPTLPTIVERRFDGLRVIIAENHRLPLVSLAVGRCPRVVALAGSARHRDVDHGSRRHGRSPTSSETSVSTEYGAIELTARTEDIEAAAASTVEAIRNPRFDDKTLGTVREFALTDAASHDTSARTVAGRMLDRILFGRSSLRSAGGGHLSERQAGHSDDTHAFWQTAWAPGTLTLVIVGDVDSARVERIAHTFASLAGPAPKLDAPALPAYTAKLGVFDLPGATTSVVIVGRRSDPAGEHQLPGDVANLLLGGGPDARLDKVLHEQLKVTLGAGSSYWRGRLAGSWSVAASFPTERTVEGLRATLAEIERWRTTKSRPPPRSPARRPPCCAHSRRASRRTWVRRACSSA